MKTNKITPRIFLLLSLVAIGALVIERVQPTTHARTHPGRSVDPDPGSSDGRG